MTEAKLSLIIPHGNSPQALRRLLDSVERQNCESAFEVIVVANPPEKYPRPPEWSFPYYLRWESSPRGANAARQRGIDLARGDILLFVDDDCEMRDPGFLQKHLDLHRRFPEISGFGGYYLLRDPDNLWGRTYNLLQGRWLKNSRLPDGDCLHMLGGNSSYKRQTFEWEKMDTRIIFGGTETELQLRLRRRGLRFRLVDELVIHHGGRVPFREFLRKSYQQGIGRAYIDEKHPQQPRFIFYGDPPLGSRSEAFAIFLYDLSFQAGREYFRRTRGMRAASSRIYFDVLRAFVRPSVLKGLRSHREWRRLLDPITYEILLSRRNNDRHSPENPAPPENHRPRKP